MSVLIFGDNGYNIFGIFWTNIFTWFKQMISEFLPIPERTILTQCLLHEQFKFQPLEEHFSLQHVKCYVTDWLRGISMCELNWIINSDFSWNVLHKIYSSRKVWFTRLWLPDRWLVAVNFAHFYGHLTFQFPIQKAILHGASIVVSFFVTLQMKVDLGQ